MSLRTSRGLSGGQAFPLHFQRPTSRLTWSTVLLAFITALLAVLSIGAPASAQAGGETLGGKLQTRDEAGERIFLPDVTFTVFDADGNEVGSATTDADGVWLVELPGSGVYSVMLDESTLPEGVSLRDTAKNPLEGIEVQPGTQKNALFALGERAALEDNTVRFVQLTVDGIKLGMIIAMCAIGLSLIYGTTGLTNFAHGEMVTLGAMSAFMFHVVWQLDFLGGWATSLAFAAVIAVLISGLAGGLFNRFVWKPLRDRGASLISALVVSIGLSIFFRYVFLYRFRGRARFYRDYQIQDAIDFGIFTLVPKDIFIILFSLFVLILVGLALQKTRVGKAMRAVADNRDLAESSGIDVEKVIKYVWVVGSALAGLGGVLFGMTENINWEMGFRLLLLMFAGVTLGGLGTAYGALFGSLIAGIFIQLSTLVPGISSDMKNIGALLSLIIILMVRPQGLLGRAERIG